MSLVTLQLGQAGNQLGAELFSRLAEELRFSQGHEGELSPAAGAFFYMASVGGETRLTARAVLLDMEPKVVQAAVRAGRGRWHYSKLGQLTRQSGSGNNWAMGYAYHGPAVREQAMNMIRRQVERCDSLGGFLLLHSVAGGTGSGLGTFLAEALREEYAGSRMLSHCIWPHECGEVAVQPYNSLLSLSHLSRICDGLLLVENEALGTTCQKLLGIQRPSFADMNALAARNLASVLLPATVRQAQAGADSSTGRAGGGRPGCSSSSTVAGPGQGPGSVGGRGARPAWDDSIGATEGGGSPSRRTSGGCGGGEWDGTFGSGSRWGDEDASGIVCGSAGGRGWAGNRRAQQAGAAAGSWQPGQLRILGDICEQLCAHPSYRLLTLRSVPQVPPGCVDFTTFTWPSQLKRLKQMLVTGRTVDAGLDWSAGASTRASGGSRGGGGRVNKSISSLLVLRGLQAREADVSAFLDPALSPAWQVDPLLVCASPQRFVKLDMCATLLSNCQAPIGPISRMLDRACRLYDARAYCHQFHRYGVSPAELDQAFEAVEDIVAKYGALG